MAGYLLVDTEKVPEEFNAGFSLYAAAWPLLAQYPGHNFQTGLFGTWMHAQYEGEPPKDLYSDIEGGLGWWRDTRFPTETPKFIMGGVAVNFSEIANGPAHGAGDWDRPRGLYGVAQLSPWLLFPIDGLDLARGTCGELFGYGYLPLPLVEARKDSQGKELGSADNCWTLFLNTKSFKGPVCFFTPYFWAHSAIVEPKYAGLLLDKRPSAPNKAFQMETQWVPAAVETDAKNETYARVAPTSFPLNADDKTVVLHRLTSYKKAALWDAVKAWFDGGPPASGTLDPAGAWLQKVRSGGGSTWRIYAESTPKEQRATLDWKSFATPKALDEFSYGYEWSTELVQRAGKLATLPEYYKLRVEGEKRQWIAAEAREVPASTGLQKLKFDPPHEEAQPPYETPSAAKSCWKSPGPVAGPFTARLRDGSVVTYSWYRFADQPALLNCGLSKAERERMQTLVEKLHRNWTKEREYLAPPTRGKLAELDPAQIVRPPQGLEIGYVPIATRQEHAPVLRR
ncbi:MAG: hypothetical protein IPJ19_07875 [Planctomycetes bacterium]|nr:hypothetical protein [Planctomycetota bacterium]